MEYNSSSHSIHGAANHNATFFSAVAAPSPLDPPPQYQPLNLNLNITQELINEIENIINPYLPQQSNKPSHEKKKSLNFPISKITIGEWTRSSLNPNDLRAKFYFARKKFLWQFLDVVDTEKGVEMLNRKIEMNWDDVLSLKATCLHDETEILKVELRKCPTFFIETNQRPGKHTQWKELDQDFTENQSASKFRRHELHFPRGELQKNLEKLMSGDSFWSKLANVTFPTLPTSLNFDIGNGNSSSNNNNNSTRYDDHDHTVLISSNVNDDFLYKPPQGFGHMPMGTMLCPNIATPMNPIVQDFHQNNGSVRLRGTQVIPIQPSPTTINSTNLDNNYYTNNNVCFHS
ncbi:unnamed protein product [Cochlearia groenlandica]